VRVALDTIAGMLMKGRFDAVRVDWDALRFQHTAVRHYPLQEEIELGSQELWI